MPVRVDRLVAVLSIATIFLPAFRIHAEPVDLYLSYPLLPVIVVLCLAAGGNLVNRGLVVLLTALTAHSVLSIALFGNHPMSAAQQLVGITAFLLVFYNVAYVNRFDTSYLFSIYMLLAKLAAAIAGLQVLSGILGVRAGYDLGWIIPDYYQSYTKLGLPRIQSVFSEPSHFALAMSPAIYVAVLSLIGASRQFAGRAWSGLILGAAALSFSATAYAAIVLAICLAGLRHGLFRKVVILSMAGIFLVGAYALVPEFRIRVDDTFLAFLYEDTLHKNVSTLTLYNNWRVALDNLVQSWFVGGGLGSHPLAFERYSTLRSLDSLPYWLASLNARDANSLLLRILSELGLPGILALSGFLWTHYVARPARTTGSVGSVQKPEDETWIVSNAALTFVAVALLRHGHYFAAGTPFFLILYYYTWRCSACQTELPLAGEAPAVTEPA